MNDIHVVLSLLQITVSICACCKQYDLLWENKFMKMTCAQNPSLDFERSEFTLCINSHRWLSNKMNDIHVVLSLLQITVSICACCKQYDLLWENKFMKMTFRWFGNGFDSVTL